MALTLRQFRDRLLLEDRYLLSVSKKLINSWIDTAQKYLQSEIISAGDKDWCTFRDNIDKNGIDKEYFGLNEYAVIQINSNNFSRNFIDEDSILQIYLTHKVGNDTFKGIGIKLPIDTIPNSYLACTVAESGYFIMNKKIYLFPSTVNSATVIYLGAVELPNDSSEIALPNHYVELLFKIVKAKALAYKGIIADDTKVMDNIRQDVINRMREKIDEKRIAEENKQRSTNEAARSVR